MAREPLSLDAPAELAGDWWVPEDPETRARGRLIYSASEGLQLDITTGGGVFGIEEPQPWINGQTVDGRDVTLRDSTVTGFSMSLPGGERARLRIRQAFVGLHASAESELRFVALRARMTNLREWLGVTGLSVHTGFRWPRISYTPQSPVILGRAAGASVIASFEGTGTAEPTRTPFTLAVEEHAWLNLKPRRSATFDELRASLDRFNSFLSFAAAAECPYLEIVGEARVRIFEFGPTGPRAHGWTNVPVWVLEHPATLPRPPRAQERMLFGFDDIQQRNLRPLNRWFRGATLFEPVTNLYLSALPTRELHLEYRFLAFAQALKAYHLRKHPANLAYQKRIQALVDELPAGVRRLVPSHFAELTKVTRHYFSHWNPRLQAKAARGQQLVSLTFAVKLLFEFTMARELGFPKREIQRWFLERNRRLVWEIQSSFLAL
jgi:hypothetical protein